MSLIATFSSKIRVTNLNFIATTLIFIIQTFTKAHLKWNLDGWARGVRKELAAAKRYCGRSHQPINDAFKEACLLVKSRAVGRRPWWARLLEYKKREVTLFRKQQYRAEIRKTSSESWRNLYSTINGIPEMSRLSKVLVGD